MCGIAGIIAPGLPQHEIGRLVRLMTNSIVHRGPDDEGFFVADGIALGMRRLSIIDVAGGRQPITNEDGRVQVVFNGEIYNYSDLRRRLQTKHVFRTASDTEVIAHLYEDQGVRCLEELRGMFSIGLWDDINRKLLLARDRIGKKPLFYATDGGCLLFASEIKAILAARPELAVADPDCLVPYFRFGFVPEPRTMFGGIRKLPAAHWLTYQNGQVKTGRYWGLNFDGDSETENRRPSDLVEELDALLEESVRIRLMSEVPLGVFLSGGLDSSTVVAYANKAGLRPLRTYTIGFDRPDWDESEDAEVVARHFQTEHHSLRLSERDLSASLPETVHSLVHHFDEPFGDSSALPTYHVSKLARENVTVILSGDGGDELFFGYTSYRGIRFAELYKQAPEYLHRWLPAAVRAGAKVLPAGWRYGALRTEKILRDSAMPFESMYFSKSCLCRDALLRQLFTTDMSAWINRSAPQDCPDDIRTVLRSDWPALNKASYMDMRHRLVEDMLVKVDRMSMAHSLEVRSPLLDHRLVEFAAKLPSRLKLRRWETKAILRDTVARYLPARTLRKRKQGFSVPLRDWLRTGLHEMVLDYLEPTHGRLPAEMFNAHTVRQLLKQHYTGEVDHSGVIWLLLNYATWSQMYLGGVGIAAGA